MYKDAPVGKGWGRLLSESNPWDKYLAKESEEASQPAARPVASPRSPPAQVIDLAPRRPTGSLKLEQNLACELPVCVANRRDVQRQTIEFESDAGVVWRLARTADRLLPAPEHYRLWLWFLDRCHSAAERGAREAPSIKLNPPELFQLFGGGLRGGGSWYQRIDEAFERFSSLVIRTSAAFYLKGQSHQLKGNLGTLIQYRSWRAKPDQSQEPFDFVKGAAIPGPLLWASIQSGYLLSVPLEPLQHLEGYIAQRLYTYLCKHCRSGGEFTISIRKLLAKIPMSIALRDAGKALRPHHKALLELGFLNREPQFSGRGEDRLVTYYR